MSELSKRAREIVDEIKTIAELEEVEKAVAKRQKILSGENEIARVKRNLDLNNVACSLKDIPLDELGPGIEKVDVDIYSNFTCYGIKEFSTPEFDELQETTTSLLEELCCSCEPDGDNCSWSEAGEDYRPGDYDDPVEVTHIGGHYLYYKPAVPTPGLRVVVVADEAVYFGHFDESGKKFIQDKLVPRGSDETAKDSGEWPPLEEEEAYEGLPMFSFKGDEDEKEESEEEDAAKEEESEEEDKEEEEDE